MEYVYNGDYLNGTYGKNYDSIVKYLVKKKLVEANNINIDHLFCNKVAKFFTEMTKNFFIDITKNISEEFKTATYLGFEHMRKDLENLACV